MLEENKIGRQSMKQTQTLCRSLSLSFHSLSPRCHFRMEHGDTDRKELKERRKEALRKRGGREGRGRRGGGWKPLNEVERHIETVGGGE